MDNRSGSRRTLTLAPLLRTHFGSAYTVKSIPTFMGCPSTAEHWKSSDFAVVSMRGRQIADNPDANGRFGADAIAHGSLHLSSFDEELRQDTLSVSSVYSFPLLDFRHLPWKTNAKRIQSIYAKILKTQKIPFGIGEDHTISLGAVQALQNASEEKFGVLQFGAHAGLSAGPFDPGDDSTALMGQIHQLGVPLVQVGQRSIQPSEIEYILQHEIPLMMMSEIRQLGLDELTYHLVRLLPENLYITLHVSCFDPSIMPSTHSPEPGGLTWYELCQVLRAVMFSRRILGVDIVGLTPIEGLIAPNILAAKLFYRMIGYIVRTRHG